MATDHELTTTAQSVAKTYAVALEDTDRVGFGRRCVMYIGL